MALWNLKIVSIGRPLPSVSMRLMPVSQLKRLELMEGADCPKERERRDFEVVIKLLFSIPRPGTQQDCLVHGICTVRVWILLCSCEFEFGFGFDRLFGLSDSLMQQDGLQPLLASRNAFAGQQPVVPEDKHISLGRPLHAQPEKRVTRAISEGGAAMCML